jgi:hypothetical protein
MGDPITMAMIGAGVGAITNPRKPLQGALLGGALGGFGGAAMGAGNAAATATMKGAMMPAAGTGVTAGAALPAAPGVAATAPFATATMPTYAATGGTTGLIGSTTAPVAMADRFRALGQFNRENPMVGQLGSNAFQNLMEPQPVMAAPSAGLMRGTPSAIEQPQYSAMAQRQPISLI